MNKLKSLLTFESRALNYFIRPVPHTMAGLFYIFSLIIFFGSFVYFLIGLFLLLRIAPELNDSAYFIFQSKYPENFSIQLHPFGIYWKIFFGEQSIIVNRLVHLALMLCAPALLVYRLKPNTIVRDNHRYINSFLVASMSLAFYRFGIVEPSYNSLIAVVSCIMFAISVSPISKLKQTPDIIIRSTLLGVFVPISILTKLSSGFLVSVIAFLYLLISIRNERIHCARKYFLTVSMFCIGCALGAFIPVIFSASDPITIFRMLTDSVEIFTSLAAHDNSIMNFILQVYWYFRALLHIDRVIFFYFGIVLMPLVISMLYYVYIGKIIVNKIFMGLLLVLMFYSLSGAPNFTQESYARLSENFTSVVFYLMFISLALNFWHSRRISVIYYLPIFFSGLLITIGTNNSYFIFAPYYICFYFLGALYFSNGDHLTGKCQLSKYRIQQTGLATAVILSASVVQFANAKNALSEPYRFFGKIDESLEAIEFSVPSETLLASPVLASSYRSISHLKRQNGINQDSQTVLDWTGRSPGILLHLGLRPIGTSWLVGSYPGEDDFAEKVISKVKHADVRDAWIIVSDKMTRNYQLLVDVLAEHGRKYPADYHLIGSFFNPNEKSINKIFAPKNIAMR